tara:strand:- start:3972 stop:4226 length:255 start_codon:yes stop_codon:yes gene_type:complete
MKTYKSAFELVEDNPAKVRLLKAKFGLMNEVIDLINYKINSCDYTQKDVAVMLGVTQPRISRLLSGGFSEFSIDMLTQFKFGLE